MQRNIKIISLLNFFTDLKFHSAILILYFSHITGSYALSMSLFSVIMVSSAVFEVPTGIFSDFIGRKKTVMMGALFATMCEIFFALGGNYWILFTGAVLGGIARSWYSGNNDALLHDSVESMKNSKSYAHYLGKTSAMFQFALMVGAVVGSILAQWSFSIIMWISVIPQALCIILSFFLVDPPLSKNSESNIFSHIKISALHLFTNKKLRLLSLQEVISFAVGESSFQFGSAFIATLWPIWAIGFSKMISYGGAAISYWMSGMVIKKYGEYTILIVANMYTRVSNIIAYGFPTPFSPVLMASSSIFYGAASVSKNALMQQEYTQNQRATLSSINSFLGNVGFGLYAPLLGFIADAYSPAIALLFVQACMFSVLFINYRLKYLSENPT